MSRYQSMFATLHDKSEGALIPFFVLGYPNPQRCLAAIDAAVAAGVDALELGIPYSDPVADGPTIVAAAKIAREQGVDTDLALQMVQAIRAKYSQLPIGLLVYANLVYASGAQQFLVRAKNAGADSILIADVPLRESQELRAFAAKAQIELVFILPPNANAISAEQIARHSQGYVYLLSRAGVTGAEQTAGMPIEHLLRQLKQVGSAPPILGFGISTAEHVRAALDAGVAGVIVGSALVSVLQSSSDDLHELTSYLATLKAATRLTLSLRNRTQERCTL